MTQQELEERLAKLEGAMGQHSQRLDTLTSDVQGLAGAKREHEKRLDKQTLRIANLELWRDDAAAAVADIGDIEQRVAEAEQAIGVAQRMALDVDTERRRDRAESERRLNSYGIRIQNLERATGSPDLADRIAALEGDALAGRVAELEKAKIMAQAKTAQATAKKPLPKEVERSIALMRKYGYFGDAASLEEFIRKELGL